MIRLSRLHSTYATPETYKYMYLYIKEFLVEHIYVYFICEKRKGSLIV